MTTGQAGYRPTQYSVGQMLLDPSFDSSLRQASTPKLQRHRGHQAQSPLGHSHSDAHSTRPAQSRPLARLETPFLVPTTEDEEKGQVDLVVFAEGLVQFRGKWFLYYGQADRTLGVAVADVQD